MNGIAADAQPAERLDMDLVAVRDERHEARDAVFPDVRLSGRAQLLGQRHAL